jgi:hypothetical protein
MHHVLALSAVPCVCTRWVCPEGAAPASTLRTDARCEDDCLCRDHHPPGALYYVTCCRNHDLNDSALLLGPFASHAIALGFVDAARDAAERVDPHAIWYAYGTMAISASFRQPGKLNDLVLKVAPELERPASRPRRAPPRVARCPNAATTRTTACCSI